MEVLASKLRIDFNFSLRNQNTISNEIRLKDKDKQKFQWKTGGKKGGKMNCFEKKLVGMAEQQKEMKRKKSE
jgi:hypothetical protein